MRDYIKEIADKLTIGNTPIVLYGAGLDAAHVITEMQSRYSVLPTCICDRDKNKQGKQIFGVDVLSLEDVKLAYPNAFFFVASETYRHQIIGELTERENISNAKIINFEPVEKRLSCLDLERSLQIGGHILRFCCYDYKQNQCSMFKQNQTPFITFCGDYDKATKEFVKYRDELINNINSGISTPCDGCPCLAEDYFPARRNIKFIAHGEGGICNFNCHYCHVSVKNTSRFDDSQDIDYIKLVDALEYQGLLSDDYSVDVAFGEVTINPKRGELYKCLEKSKSVILTNASVYDEKLTCLLKKGNAHLLVSLDSGTKETFHAVKGVDLFDKVYENLTRYNQEVPWCLVLKYILLPGLNDNTSDIDGFLELCENVEAVSIQITTNFLDTSPMSSHAKKMLHYLADKMQEKGFLYSVISDVARSVLSERD